MEHPLQSITVNYYLTHDLQLVERSPPLTKQILMPAGLQIQGRNVLRHLIEPRDDIKGFKLYRHAFATRVSTIALEKVDPRRIFDLKTLYNSSFIVVVPQSSVPAAEKQPVPDPVLQEASQPAISTPTREKMDSFRTGMDRPHESPQKKQADSIVSNTSNHDTKPISKEHTSVNHFLSLLYAATSCKVLDLDLHCPTRGRCACCRSESVHAIDAGCHCSLCIYCAVARVSTDQVTCGCGVNYILPFSQWAGLSNELKQLIRQLAKKNQIDPYVHSQYNDLVDVLQH